MVGVNQFETVRIKGGYIIFDMINNDIAVISNKGKKKFTGRVAEDTFDILHNALNSIFTFNGTKYRVSLEVNDEKANS